MGEVVVKGSWGWKGGGVEEVGAPRSSRVAAGRGGREATGPWAATGEARGHLQIY